MRKKEFKYEGQTLGGLYFLEKGLGQGGMGSVYRAKPNLERFDYAKVLAFRGKEADKARRTLSTEQYIRVIETRYKKLRSSERAEKTRKKVEAYPNVYPSKRVCAVKILEKPTNAYKFLAEWTGLMGLSNCRNVIVVYDGGIAKLENGREVPYYTMECLEDLLKKKDICNLPLDIQLKIAVKAGRGINELHHNGIIHRDIKPDNILITKKGIVKVSDTGIAKNMLTDRKYETIPEETEITDIAGITHRIFLESREKTLAGAVIGTPHYMSPEQARGEDLSFETDIFSFGNTIQYWLTGKEPYEELGRDARSIIKAIIRGRKPESIKKLRPELPKEIVGIINKMTKPKPYQRYTTMDEVIDALENVDVVQKTIVPVTGVRVEKGCEEQEIETLQELVTKEKSFWERPFSRRKVVAGALGLAAVFATSTSLIYHSLSGEDRLDIQDLLDSDVPKGSLAWQLKRCLEFTPYHKARLEGILEKAKGTGDKKYERYIAAQLKFIQDHVKFAYYFDDHRLLKRKIIKDDSGNYNDAKIIGDIEIVRGRSGESSDFALFFDPRKESGSEWNRQNN
jgi:serine/threonine protein kinase